jgi:hypothetical protein
MTELQIGQVNRIDFEKGNVFSLIHRQYVNGVVSVFIG